MKLGDIFVPPLSSPPQTDAAICVQVPQGETLIDSPKLPPSDLLARGETFSYDPAIPFLLNALSQRPQRISDVIREWCGARDGTNGRWIRDLNAARDVLGVSAYGGTDGRMWWRLPAFEETTPPPRPTQPCSTCGNHSWWRNRYEWWLCGRCHEPTLSEMVEEWVYLQHEEAA